MARQRFELRQWRWCLTEGWIIFPAIFAVTFWIVTVQSLVQSAPIVEVAIAGVPAVVLTAVTIVTYKVRLGRARAVLRARKVVVATVVGNEAVLGTQPPSRRLTYEYVYDDQHHTKRLVYTPANTAAYKTMLFIHRRFGGGPPARDDNGWILSLKRGDTVQVLVDPKRPQRSHVLRLWTSSSGYGG